MGDTFNCQSIYIFYTLPSGDNGGFGSTDPLQIQQPDVSTTTGRRKRKSAPPDPQPPRSKPTTSTPRTPRTYKKKKRALLTETALTGRENYADDSGEQITGEGHGHQSKKKGEKSGEREQ
ncbi:hypothetical protein QYM36_018598 [Artemia franciscana]|uniref:Uncharacterized protein n=1 Tax=Artemia franciscana TaxID=6661 RepID=A0AA88KUK9_ARTSF|nr:hypothetical protein QYM36_018598 [Artemia franciscana]